MKINEIYEGWRNHISPPKALEEIIKKTSDARLEICATCPEHSSNKEGYSTIRMDEHCTDCGCTLSAKTKCLSCRCPLEEPKWLPVVSREKEIHMKDYGRTNKI
jgi:hypothetical protein